MAAGEEIVDQMTRVMAAGGRATGRASARKKDKEEVAEDNTAAVAEIPTEEGTLMVAEAVEVLILRLQDAIAVNKQVISQENALKILGEGEAEEVAAAEATTTEEIELPI